MMLLEKKFSTTTEIQRRANSRVTFLEPSFVQTDTRALWVKGINLSEGGMCIAVDQLGVFSRGIGIAVFILNYPAIDATVGWTRGNIVGLTFTAPMDKNPDIQALLKRLKDGEPARMPAVRPDVDAMVGDSLKDLLRSKPRDDISKTSMNASIKTVTPEREHARLDFNSSCLVKTNKKTFRAEGLNLSEGGMCLRLTGLGALHNGTDVQIIFEGFSPIDATLRWSKERVMGFQFLAPIKGHPILRDLPPENSHLT